MCLPHHLINIFNTAMPITALHPAFLCQHTPCRATLPQSALWPAIAPLAVIWAHHLESSSTKDWFKWRARPTSSSVQLINIRPFEASGSRQSPNLFYPRSSFWLWYIKLSFPFSSGRKSISFLSSAWFWLLSIDSEFLSVLYPEATQPNELIRKKIKHTS